MNKLLLFTRDRSVELTADELEADIRQREADVSYVRSEMLAINEQAGDEPLTDELQTRWDEGEQYVERNEQVLTRQRQALSLAVAQRESNGFTAPNFSVRQEDPYDISGLSLRTTPDDLQARARTAIEETAHLSDAHKEAATQTLQRMHGATGQMARHILSTGSPVYQEAWQRILTGRPILPEHDDALQFSRAALAIGADATGGYAIPFTLDPTVLDVGDHDISPIRAISRVERTMTNQWNGVTSTGVASSWDAEATEVSDDSPTLGNMQIDCHKLAIFVPYSIEVSMDWPQMQSEVMLMINRERADQEATAHAVGTGTGQPEGVTVGINGSANEITSAGVGAIAIADVFDVDDTLNQRYRQRAQWIADKSTYNAIRQLAANDGYDLWTRLPGPNPGDLIGYRANEASAVPQIATGNRVLVLGDFQNGYIVVDRVGMTVENIPHLFGATNRFPTGQRGMYAYLRTGAKVVNTNAFAHVEIQ